VFEHDFLDHRVVICHPLFKRNKSLNSTQKSDALRERLIEVIDVGIEG